MKLTENQKMLFTAVSDIEDEYIEKATHYAPRRRKFLYRFIAMAAALAIVLGIAWAVNQNTNSNLYPQLVLSADAADSTKGETFPIDYTLQEESPLLSSAPWRPPVSWGDAALFRFNVRMFGVERTDPEEYSVEISYGDQTVDYGEVDDHLSVGKQSTPMMYEISEKEQIPFRSICLIRGWFAEDTTLIIRIFVQKKGEEPVLYQEQTVTVLCRDGGYLLQVQELIKYVECR